MVTDRKIRIANKEPAGCSLWSYERPVFARMAALCCNGAAAARRHTGKPAKERMNIHRKGKPVWNVVSPTNAKKRGYIFTHWSVEAGMSANR